ncbi:MAG: hypothetical protein AAB393_10170 [Bacteroidota bacterium]
MNRTLELTDAELQELDLLVKKEWQSSEVELNHTRAFAYKDLLKERIQLLEQLSTKLTCLKPAANNIVIEDSSRSSPDGVRHHPANPVNRG